MVGAAALGLMAALLMGAKQDFNWTRPADRAAVHTAFKNMATFCARDFGFTPAPTPPDAAMADKIEAELLLAPTPEGRLSDWALIIREGHALDRAAKDDAIADRGADAIGAAVADPDNYARAEALYLATVTAPMKTAIAGCSKGGADPFVGKFYWSGTGSGDRYTDHLKRQFAASVKHIAEYKARLQTKPKRK